MERRVILVLLAFTLVALSASAAVGLSEEKGTTAWYQSSTQERTPRLWERSVDGFNVSAGISDIFIESQDARLVINLPYSVGAYTLVKKIDPPQSPMLPGFYTYRFTILGVPNSWYSGFLDHERLHEHLQSRGNDVDENILQEMVDQVVDERNLREGAVELIVFEADIDLVGPEFDHFKSIIDKDILVVAFWPDENPGEE